MGNSESCRRQIRDEALEEAAVLMETHSTDHNGNLIKSKLGTSMSMKSLAGAIRELKERDND